MADVEFTIEEEVNLEDVVDKKVLDELNPTQKTNIKTKIHDFLRYNMPTTPNMKTRSRKELGRLFLELFSKKSSLKDTLSQRSQHKLTQLEISRLLGLETSQGLTLREILSRRGGNYISRSNIIVR